MRLDNAKQIYSSVLKYYLLVICSVGLLLAVFSSEIIRIMTTDKFYAASKFIPYIIFSMIIFGIKYHFEIGIMLNKKTKYIAYINGISSISNIILNWLLISKYGIWGAIIAVNIKVMLSL